MITDSIGFFMASLMTFPIHWSVKDWCKNRKLDKKCAKLLRFDNLSTLELNLIKQALKIPLTKPRKRSARPLKV